MLPMLIWILVAVVHGDSVQNYDNAALHCGFNIFEADQLTDDVNSRHESGVSFVVDFVTGANLQGYNFSGGKWDAIFINKNQIHMLGTIGKTQIISPVVRCILFNGMNIHNADITGRYVTRIYLKAQEVITNSVINGSSLSDIYLIGRRDDTHNTTIQTTHLIGDNIERVHINGYTLNATSIKGRFASGLHIRGHSINDTVLNITHTYEVHMHGGHVNSTQIHARIIDGLQIHADTIYDSRINVSLYTTDIEVTGRIFLNESHVEAFGMFNVTVRANSVNALNITGKSLKQVFVNATESIKELRIEASQYFMGIYVNGIRLDTPTDTPHEMPKNSPKKYLSESIKISCDDTYGHPVDTELLNLSGKRCFSGFCQAMCALKGFENGICCGYTCCCKKQYTWFSSSYEENLPTIYYEIWREARKEIPKLESRMGL